MSRKKRLAHILAALGETFNEDLTTAKIGVYEKALEDVPIEQIEFNAWRHIKRGIFFPKPVELIGGTDLDLEARANVAFDVVTRTMSRVGAYNNVAFNDPVIHKVVEGMGGWVSSCEQAVDWWNKWGRKDFVKLYKAYASGSHPDPLPYLPGRGDSMVGWADTNVHFILPTGDVVMFNRDEVLKSGSGAWDKYDSVTSNLRKAIRKGADVDV